MGRRFNAGSRLVATIVGSVALVRLADAVGKRELTRAAKEVAAEAQAVQASTTAWPAVRGKLAQDDRVPELPDRLALQARALSRHQPRRSAS